MIESMEDLAKMSPAGIFALMWWLERKARIESETEARNQAKADLDAKVSLAASLASLKEVIKEMAQTVRGCAGR